MHYENRLRQLVLLVMLFLLSACGSQGDTTVDLDTVDFQEVSDELEGMSVSVTSIKGGFEADEISLDRSPQVFCLENRQNWMFVSGDDASFNIRIDFSIPSDIESGSYQAVFGSQADDTVGLTAIIQQLTGDAATDIEALNSLSFTDVQQGAINIISVPSEEGDSFSGSFQFNLLPVSFETNGDSDLDQEVLVAGAFNVVANANDDLCS